MDVRLQEMKRQEAIRRLELLRGKTWDFDVIELCDVFIGLLQAVAAKEQQQFDKVAYQREYMRKWREKKKKT